MQKLVTVEQMHAIEAAADAVGISYSAMMNTAGNAGRGAGHGVDRRTEPDRSARCGAGRQGQ